MTLRTRLHLMVALVCALTGTTAGLVLALVVLVVLRTGVALSRPRDAAR